MADIRTVFPILADSSTGAGEPAISRIEGEVAAAQEGLIGFSFKDSSGNVVLPQLLSSGAIVVDTEGVNFTCLSAQGEDTAPVVDTEADITTITLAASTTYQDIWVLVTASRWSFFRIYWVEDAGVTDVESDLGWIHVGPGQYTICCEMPCKEFITTGNGVEELRIAGTAKNQASDLRASLSVREIA